MKKIKILHIQETVASVGVEKIRLLLAKYLDKLKYEQKIVCTFAYGQLRIYYSKYSAWQPIKLLLYRREQHFTWRKKQNTHSQNTINQ
ncbi:hypothetical protein EZS27_028096 [termite gut metagenome]|uniref:Uncharacterized protein n=1 Tax=termite gut metagenome TaxID=433724 RepID=A0A5J4QMX0_9ZZZZ